VLLLAPRSEQLRSQPCNSRAYPVARREVSARLARDRARELLLAELLDRAAQVQRAAREQADRIRRCQRDARWGSGEHEAPRGESRRGFVDGEG
jgi:hypothetical protein